MNIVNNGPSQTSKIYERKIRDILDGYLGMLSRLPKGPYVTLNSDDSDHLDFSMPNVRKIRDDLVKGCLNELWNQIPFGHNRNILRAKQFKVRRLADKIIEGYNAANTLDF